MSLGSLDFLNMIKNSAEGSSFYKTEDGTDTKKAVNATNRACSNAAASFAVIDTETNWHNQVMSLGVAIADEKTCRCIDKRYYIFDPECRVGGMYSGVMNYGDVKAVKTKRNNAIEDLHRFLSEHGVRRIMAYNAKFDYGHLPELSGYQWYDIMRIAAYKQYNAAIPADAECCKTGRLKTDYGVEPILQLLSKDRRYMEIHNAVCDAIDELRIVELLGLDLSIYDCARIN